MGVCLGALMDMMLFGPHVKVLMFVFLAQVWSISGLGLLESILDGCIALALVTFDDFTTSALGTPDSDQF